MMIKKGNETKLNLIKREENVRIKDSEIKFWKIKKVEDRVHEERNSG